MRRQNKPSSTPCASIFASAVPLVSFGGTRLNGGRRSPVEAAIFNGLGVRAGVSDLILLHDGRAFALELKTERGRPTAAQMNFISEFRAAGGEASIATGLDQALHTLET